MKLRDTLYQIDDSNVSNLILRIAALCNNLEHAINMIVWCSVVTVVGFQNSVGVGGIWT